MSDAWQARFDRLTQRRAVGRLQKVYDSAQSGAIRQIARSHPTTLHATLRGTQISTARSLAGELVVVQKEAHRESLGSLVSYIRQKEGRSFSLDVPSNFEAVLDKRADLMRHQLEQTISKHMAITIGNAGDAAVQAEVAGDSVTDAIADSLDSDFWRFEMIARTETSYAYNAALYDGISVAMDDFPDMMMRWTEHVDDATWTPRDKRVAPDSLAMHGQLAGDGEEFTMPSGTTGQQGATWAFPPNRPHDRAFLMPWRKDWGIPGWVYRGKKIWLVRR